MGWYFELTKLMGELERCSTPPLQEVDCYANYSEHNFNYITINNRVKLNITQTC